MNRGGRPPKLTRENVDFAKRLKDQGHTSDIIASMLGVAGSTMRRYLRGECRQHRAYG